MTETRTLPDYANPPVVEVAVSVYFKPLRGFKTAHFGEFWALHKDDFPAVDDQPPILEAAPPQIMDLPPLRRVFLLNAAGTYLLQMQADLFAYNWRKIPSSEVYPHFDSIRKSFESRWKSFQEFVTHHRLGPLELIRYEVTYVNQFRESAGAFPMALERYSHLIRLHRGGPEYILPAPFGLAAQLQFHIPDDQGTLRVSFKHGTRIEDKADVMQVDVTAVTNAKQDGSDLSEWLETAHKWIVTGFTDLTSSEAHKLWGRTI